jgi:serine/threonine protein kinase
MPLRIEPNAEPIPGYRLIERLGGGGFGEVWKAEVPGGLFKAIKFVYGELTAGGESVAFEDPDGSRAKQELKSLNRVKSVHHPYILSLERFEVIEGQLVIVMELADRTLWDRFKECRSQGLPGIPRDELLGYIQETAEALDLMNSQFQLQHLDIKPQNIFLVFNHVKVADFGLVKDLASHNATITGGVTPVYAAPETFDGWLSRQSDQYSLAIVYQELLTGQRPFAGSTMKQLILHHLQSAPDLQQLPVADRPIVARALTKNPDDRYPNCLEFVQLLRRSVVRPTGPEMRPRAPMSPGATHDTNLTADARGNAGPVKPVEPNFGSEEEFFANRPQILPPRPDRSGDPAAPSTPAVSTPDSGLTTTDLPGDTPVRGREDLGVTTPPPSPLRGVLGNKQADDQTPGILQPALVIGLGKFGVETLTELRDRMGRELGLPDGLDQVRVLAIDTDPDAITGAIASGSPYALRPAETYLTRLQRPTYYIRTRDGKLPTDNWLNPKLLYRIPREQQTAAMRPLGRLAFVDNFRPVANRLQAALQACCEARLSHADAPVNRLGLRSFTPRVYIVTSLTGNTGSGMFLDVAYLVHKLLREQGHEYAEVIGLFFVPPARRNPAVTPAMVNTYAALVELQHFCRPEALFTARYETAATPNKDGLTESGPAFSRCVFLPLPEPRGSTASCDNSRIVHFAADFLRRDLTTQMGAAIEQQRREKVSLSNEWQLGQGPLLQSVGMYRILWPRHSLLEKCARRLCAQVVTRWMSKDAKAMADTIREWTHERWESLGMRPENLIERFQKLTAHALQQTPEQTLLEILTPLHEALVGVQTQAPDKKGAAKGDRPANMGPVVQAMDRLEGLLGNPEENRGPVSAEPSLLERTLSDIAHVIADECEQRLAELAVALLENPTYRLAGAEEALRQFCATVEKSLQSQETLAKELSEKATQLYQGIQQVVDVPTSSGNGTVNTTWKINMAKRTPTGKTPAARDVFELVRTYAKTRFHSLILAHLNRLYVSLRGHLSDQIREVGFCRARLGELLGLLQPATGSGPVSSAQTTPSAPREKKTEATLGERVLFPAGCLEMNDAVDKLSQQLTPEDVLNFDDRIQGWIHKNCQALLQVCMGSSSIVRNLAPAMVQEAESFLQQWLQGSSVAEMYVSRKRVETGDAGGDTDNDTDAAITDDLETCHDEAAPELGRLSEVNEIALASLPNDEHGRRLQQALRKHLPDLKVLLTDQSDEIIFYREIINIPWKDLEQLGALAQEAFDKRFAADPLSLHTREDITEWHAMAVAKR